jgi:hypothetical protein
MATLKLRQGYAIRSAIVRRRAQTAADLDGHLTTYPSARTENAHAREEDVARIGFGVAAPQHVEVVAGRHPTCWGVAARNWIRATASHPGVIRGYLDGEIRGRAFWDSPGILWVPKTRPGMLSRRFARRDRISRGAGRPPERAGT